MEMVFDHLVVMLHPVSYRQRTPNAKYEMWICKRKESQPADVARAKAIMWIRNRHTYFSIRLNSFSSNLFNVHLNLVKVSLIYELSYIPTSNLWYAKKWGSNVFFAGNNRIKLNLIVHRNWYNSNTNIMRQKLTCKKWVQSNLISFVP